MASQSTHGPLEIKHKSCYIFQAWKSTRLCINTSSLFWWYIWHKNWGARLGKICLLDPNIHTAPMFSHGALQKHQGSAMEWDGISREAVRDPWCWTSMYSSHFPYSNPLTSMWIQMLNKNPSPGEVWRESEISLKVCRGHCCFQWEVIVQPFQNTETWLLSVCPGWGLFTRTCMRSEQPISQLTNDYPTIQQVSRQKHSVRHPQAFILHPSVESSSPSDTYIFYIQVNFQGTFQPQHFND